MRDILSRVSHGTPGSSTILSSTQRQVDQLVGAFTHHATDGVALISMVGGAAAYRLGRLGLGGIYSGYGSQILSKGVGLAAEVATFEMAHRGLSSVSVGAHGGAPLHENLWSWNGPGGLRQGLLHSFISFGALKGAGRLAQGQNPVVQHLFQDSALVLGHQSAALLGVGERPKGSLAEQFLQAEALNLQIGAGLALMYRMAPGLLALERGMDLSLRSEANLGFAPHGDRDGRSQGSPLQPSFAFAVAGKGGWDELPGPKEKDPKRQNLILMSEKFEEPETPTLVRKSSDPPVQEGGLIEQNAAAWALEHKRPPEDGEQVARLALNIRDEMWQTLNLRIDSPEAYALAHGDLIAVQAHPLDGSLENYRIVLSSNLEAPPKNSDFVQWTLDSTTGALGSVEISAALPNPRVRLGFQPFYRSVNFVSDGLKSDALFEALSPQIQDFLRNDRTQAFQGAKEPPTIQQVAGPTVLVAYFNQIAEGARESIDRYGALHKLSEKGTTRLQRLVQFILAAIYEKESAYPKYSQYPQFHIWVIPHPELPDKKKVEVMTSGEAFQWHQDRGGKVGARDLLFILDRTYYGPDKTHPFLAHQYTKVDRQGRPYGADLEFQNYLGLTNERMKIYLLDLVPSPEKIAEWEAQKKN